MANLHLVTGYAGTEHVTAADQGAFHALTMGSGQCVINTGKKFEASIVSNNLVKVLDGEIYMQGRYIRLEPEAYAELAIATGTQGMLRHDLIVARYKKTLSTGVEEANLVVITGAAAASSPSDPEYTTGNILDGELQNDIPLHRVVIDGLTITGIEPLYTAKEFSLDNKLDVINLLTPESAIADADTFPFFDESAGANRKVPWSAIRGTITKTFTASVSTGWTSDSTNGGYYKNVTVSGILATDNPIVDLVLGTDVDANALYVDAWNNVTRITTAANTVKLWANAEAPTSAFNIQIKVVR